LGLEKLRERFDEMEAELQQEVKEDESLPEGVERMVQTFITSIRQMMAGAADKEAEFWSKLKQLELHFWELKNSTVDYSSALRDWVKSTFKTLQTVGFHWDMHPTSPASPFRST
jgi:hypothetical protein